jgi:AraC family transcriptional regulator of adaptative response/methylated-DNA-[protein]-cysteine methyltransferase
MNKQAQTDYERIAFAIQWLDQHKTEQPQLGDLAAALGQSSYHVQRLFKRWAGITPKQFLQYLTVGHAKQLLRHSHDVLSTSLETGLSGPGRLHDQMINVEAMSPGEYRTGARGVEIRYGIHPSPFGLCLLALTDRGICHLGFLQTGKGEDLKELQLRWPEAQLVENRTETALMVERIFGHHLPGQKKPLPVVLKGTNFQVKVWEALLSIPPGHALTYRDVATQIRQPRAARAVGTAIAANRIGFLIPCHRVIRQSGIIGRYQWGTERKRAMLLWEAGLKN